eukprot:4415582-Pleurochrysis_carterae.AAC.1
MAQQSMPTAKATSGRVCVEQYSSAPTRDWYEAKSLPSMKREGLLSSACSTSLDVGNAPCSRGYWILVSLNANPTLVSSRCLKRSTARRNASL